MHQPHQLPQPLPYKRKKLNLNAELIFNNSTKKKRVVIAGSHGKTTITSMVSHVLKKQNIDFDYILGAKEY